MFFHKKPIPSIFDIHHAVSWNQLDDVTQLVSKHGNNPEVINSFFKVHTGYDDPGKTVLMKAVQHNNIGIVRTLLKAPAIDPNFKCQIPWEYGRYYAAYNTALLLAISRNRVDIVKVILDHAKIDVNQTNPFKQTPLICAARSCPGAIPLLLKKMEMSLSLNAQDYQGKTVLHYIGGSKDKIFKKDKILKKPFLVLLHTPGINPDVFDNEDRTPLMNAAQHGNEAYVRALIDIGANSELTNKNGQTAADLAELYGHQKIVKLLKKHSAGHYAQKQTRRLA